jgi:hypothetical protein
MPDALISAADKRRSAERELRFRERVYPRWVAEGRMTAAAATHEIAVMRAIAADYAAAERQGLLF